jgi:colanic acid biosynthesis protein WcaH
MQISKRRVWILKNLMADIDTGFISKDIYGGILDKVPVCTVDVIFFNQKKDKTLLFCRNNEPLRGIYFSIGGRLNKNETFLECAVRQAKRELDLDIEVQKLFFGGVQKEDYHNSMFAGVAYSTVNIFYGYILEEENPTLNFDDQHSASKWVSIDDSSLHPFLKSKLMQTLSKLP